MSDGLSLLTYKYPENHRRKNYGRKNAFSDGFRLDVFTRFKKPAGFPDTKKAPDPKLARNGFVVDTSMCTNVEGIHEIVQELYREVFGPRDCMTVGEGAEVTYQNALNYVCASRKELDLEDHEDLIVYLRRCARQTLLVVANLSGKTVPFPVPEALKENLWERRLTNREDTQSSLDTGRDLLPWELEIYELAK